MDEIQCFDGDGVVPPELQALIKENGRLKELLENRDREIRGLRKENNKLEQELRDFGNKLWKIQSIVNEKDMVEEEYPTKRVWDKKYEEHEDEPEVVPNMTAQNTMSMTAREAFNAMMDRNA